SAVLTDSEATSTDASISYLPLQSALRRQPRKQPLHAVDAPEIGTHVVVATALSGSQSEAALGVGFARPGAAQVDQGSEILLLLQRGGGNSLPLERRRDG